MVVHPRQNVRAECFVSDRRPYDEAYNKQVKYFVLALPTVRTAIYYLQALFNTSSCTWNTFCSRIVNQCKPNHMKTDQRTKTLRQTFCFRSTSIW